MNPFISICIPAYKNTSYLDVLLRSIEIQTFKDYEVIVSDDSPADDVELLCKSYAARFPLTYQRNFPAKGSPANWNHGIHLAKGTWIKIMHDDDWFASNNSLQVFAKAATEHPGTEFIFSGYADYENEKIKYTSVPGKSIVNRLTRSPLDLFIKNFIGNPSTTLIRNDLSEWYDENLKWVVDFEFYIRCLSTKKLYAIPEVLIYVGIHHEQITREVFRNPSVEIPENIYMLNKFGTVILNKIRVYDYYWRLFRNLDTRKMDEVIKYAGANKVPVAIVKMLKLQTRFPLPVLKVGVLSKLLMAASFLGHRILRR